MNSNLLTLMQQRRQLIATVPGFRSGATDRSNPILHRVQDLDVAIAKAAAQQGLTEIQAWRAF